MRILLKVKTAFQFVKNINVFKCKVNWTQGYMLGIVAAYWLCIIDQLTLVIEKLSDIKRVLEKKTVVALDISRLRSLADKIYLVL